MSGHCGSFAYTVSFECDPDLPPEVIAAEVQTSLFYDGASPAGCYDRPYLRGDGRWVISLKREDCATDFHSCASGYPEFGHDGSDEAAITQLQNEIDEAIAQASLPPLAQNYQVEDRTRNPL